MTTWMKYVLGICLPLMFFMVMQDTVAGFYSSRATELSYVVVEPEEEAAVVEEDAALDASDAEAPAEEDVAEAAPEEAPVEETTEAPAVTEDAAAEQEQVADAAPVEEAPAEAEDAPAAAPATDMVATLTADEMAAGERAARACASCHQFERTRNAVGPHLVDVGGRLIGSVEGFRYSDALMDLNAQGAVWTAEEIEAWLADPSEYAPGTKMNFQVRDAEERRLIAGWLAQREQ